MRQPCVKSLLPQRNAPKRQKNIMMLKCFTDCHQSLPYPLRGQVEKALYHSYPYSARACLWENPEQDRWNLMEKTLSTHMRDRVS